MEFPGPSVKLRQSLSSLSFLWDIRGLKEICLIFVAAHIAPEEFVPFYIKSLAEAAIGLRPRPMSEQLELTDFLR